MTALMRRFSETRRPHPLGTNRSISRSIQPSAEARAHPHTGRRDRQHLEVHRSRAARLSSAKSSPGKREESKIMVYVTSFGYRHGVPADSDLVFDVRFLPNPNYIPQFKKLTGRHPAVARYIRSFPQTIEFIDRISDLLIYLLPHYIREGKSYLTIAFRLHRRPSPLGHDCRPDSQEPGARRLQGEGHTPGRREGRIAPIRQARP